MAPGALPMQMRQGSYCSQKDGRRAPAGATSSMACRHHPERALDSEIGPMAGSSTRRGLSTVTIVTTCYCRPCRPISAPCCIPSPGPCGLMARCHPGQGGHHFAASSYADRASPPIASAPSNPSGHCGPSPGWGQQVGMLKNHVLACPCTGLLARREKVVMLCARLWGLRARSSLSNGLRTLRPPA